MAEKQLSSLRPSTLIVKDAGQTYKFTADNHNDLLWLYYHFQSQKVQEAILYECTGHKLKVRLRVSAELVGELIKDEVVYETALAEQIHSKLFIES